MERTEPTFIPEWLKKPGAVNGSCSTSNPDEQTASGLMRNKSFVNSNGYDSGRPFSSVKTTSSYFSRSSSNNGSGHVRSRSSFGRNQHARDYDRDTSNSFDKHRSVSGDRQRKDFSDVRGNAFSKNDRNGLRHSQSVVSRKRGDTWHKKVITDSSTASVSNTNGLHSKSNLVGRVSKLTFDRNFPSLAEERAVTPEVGRVPSPGLSSAIQSLSISSSATTSDENLTSVLAEVPTGMLSVQQVSPSSVMSGASGTPSNLNMAEAVALGHNRVQIAPQLSTETQRLEELAIKQSRQLIPVTPSMPKTLVSSSLDKQKAKAGSHSVLSPFAVSLTPRTNGPAKSDISKPSLSGKLHVLKPVREKNGGKAISSALAAASVSSGSASISAASNCPGHESKPVLNPVEKRPSFQARSRNDFFNSVRKKSMANSSALPELGTSTAVLSSVSAEMEVVITSKNHDDSACVVNGHGDTCAGVNRDELATSDLIFSEEEEAAFLRSLGWEENADESALTEEEISAFFRDVAKYINSNPSLKIPQAVYPKFSLPFDSPIVGVTSIPSGLSSPDAKLEL